VNDSEQTLLKAERLGLECFAGSQHSGSSLRLDPSLGRGCFPSLQLVEGTFD